MSTTLTHRGLPDGTGRLDLLALVENLGKRRTGLSSTGCWNIISGVHEIATISRGTFVPCGSAPAAQPMILPSAATPSTNPNASLRPEGLSFAPQAEMGRDLDYGTKARFGGRQELTWLLIDRYDELKATWDTRRLHQQAMAECKAEIRRLRRLIRADGETSRLARAEEILPDGRIAPINRMDRLEAIRSGLAELLADIALEAQERPHASTSPRALSSATVPLDSLWYAR